jgi:hypothetical protein
MFGIENMLKKVNFSFFFKYEPNMTLFLDFASHLYFSFFIGLYITSTYLIKLPVKKSQINVDFKLESYLSRVFS